MPHYFSSSPGDWSLGLIEDLAEVRLERVVAAVQQAGARHFVVNFVSVMYPGGRSESWHIVIKLLERLAIPAEDVPSILRIIAEHVRAFGESEEVTVMKTQIIPKVKDMCCTKEQWESYLTSHPEEAQLLGPWESPPCNNWQYADKHN